ncbi:MAG TPA: hypothetical protein VKE49_01805 [Myxococcaceae bacterium]|nr:hypothetical protein [Myxococcaceae bacterium]
MKVNNFCAHLECFFHLLRQKRSSARGGGAAVAVYLSPPSAGGRCYKLRTSDPNISIPTREFGVLVKGRPQIVEETISDNEIRLSVPFKFEVEQA